ncbi:MAG: nitrate reductase subunit alpha [Gemmatimonadales bacterium]|nr:MAG: nitrate reductase subunit alpha [Gemmatimonadales bacterium]
MSWIKDVTDPKFRVWEEFYRNRWQYDKQVRSTHGVNCTGGCSWMIYVKDGIVTWEMQATDYPKLEAGLPPYEPRGCQRGISFSWYLYSPIRVKYPYIRGVLADLWREAKRIHGDPVAAWASIVEDDTARSSFHRARGKGGFRRASWDEVLEIQAAANIYTIKKYGPDRVIGFSPIPAMSMLSYAGGSRFLQLMGAVNLSFYDWYSDLPPASPEVWGEQTDVQESASWYKAKYLVVMGANLNMTRTPDVHFAAEARHNGTKMVVFSPDLSQVSRYADWWVPVNAGQDGAFWMAANHVILKEYHADRQVPYFTDYLKNYSDAPFLVTLEQTNDGWRASRLLRATDIGRYASVENPDFKFLVMDEASSDVRLPRGSIGHRWEKPGGRWNLEMKDDLDDSEITPTLSFLDEHDEVLQVGFSDFAEDVIRDRGVPVRFVETERGRVAVTTSFDLLMSQFGVGRGLAGDYPVDYDDASSPYTPAWQEGYTGISPDTVIQFAREFANNGEATNGKNTVIIGAGINHWYHNNLIYRGPITGLMLTGSVGVEGGGLSHYVGQEKLAPVSSWASIAFATDWEKPPRLMNAPSFHYVHTDQWRYEAGFEEYHPVPDADLSKGHTIDQQVRAVRLGWLPFYPQFPRNSLDLVKDAEAAGAKTDEEVVDWVADQIRTRKLPFSVEDPDAPENWPRVWYIWRGNALMSSAKGHEYFLRHYLGTHDNAIADEKAEGTTSEVEYVKDAPRGKFDLVVDLNFRMDTSALYSDIVLPAATWYEKNDLNTTDLHSFIHPLTQAVPPCWESRSDWDIFKALTEVTTKLAKTHLPEPVRDIVAVPLQHDSPDEMAQPYVKDWLAGECEFIPGKTGPKLMVVERDYSKMSERFISLGPKARERIGAHGTSWNNEKPYDELVETAPTVLVEGVRRPSLEDAVEAANVILALAPETNGEVAYQACKAHEEKVGLQLADLAEPTRGVRMTFEDIVAQPRRLLTTPVWSGLSNDGRPYSPFTYNVERLVPWRTLTGRQQFYLDHQGYIDFGEHLPTYKPKPDAVAYGDLRKSVQDDKTLLLNYLTPHGKWHIHSTYYDNHRMLTLSRGIEPFWLNDRDADSVGIVDNDWVEAHNDHGVVVTRAVVSSRVPRGVCIFYHSPERTISVPKSPLRGNRRAGGHNSLTRTRLKPVLMMGGYGQFTYHFNYWGPTGTNRDTHVMVKKLEGKPVF